MELQRIVSTYGPYRRCFLNLFRGFTLHLGNAVMIWPAPVLIYLAVVKEYRTGLLLPIGFGCILANIPGGMIGYAEGMFNVLYEPASRPNFSRC